MISHRSLGFCKRQPGRGQSLSLLLTIRSSPSLQGAYYMSPMELDGHKVPFYLLTIRFSPSLQGALYQPNGVSTKVCPVTNTHVVCIILLGWVSQMNQSYVIEVGTFYSCITLIYQTFYPTHPPALCQKTLPIIALLVFQAFLFPPVFHENSHLCQFLYKL